MDRFLVMHRARILAIVAAVLASTQAASAQHGRVKVENPGLPVMPPVQADHGVFQTIAELQPTPGNVAVTPQGRLFVSMHPFGSPEIKVAEVLRNGSIRAYPTEGWSRAVSRTDRPSGTGIESIIGIRSDGSGTLWMLDIGSLGTPEGMPPKLIAWDTINERLGRVIHIPPPVSSASSFLQDFAIDPKREAIYIADCGIGRGFDDARPAIVVVHLRTGVARRVLENADCVKAEPDAAMIIDGREVRSAGPDGAPIAPRVGINPITIDDEHEWVYFGAMHGRTLWKIRAEDLANPGLDDAMLASRVVRHGTKPVSDGISIDSKGNVYVTDVGANGIGVVEPDGTYRLLFSDPTLLSWPDGMSAGPDGAFYVSVNQLHKHAALNMGTDEYTKPFRVVRFVPLAPATVGR
jgi:sugar lactone lactonase YvrE